LGAWGLVGLAEAVIVGIVETEHVAVTDDLVVAAADTAVVEVEAVYTAAVVGSGELFADHWASYG
jgi:hypothetical protein